MNRILQFLPEIEMDEAIYLDMLMKEKSDEQIRNFTMMYRSRRKDPQTILLTTLLGFFIIAGIQRFMINQIGMGILYIFTGGLCFIGTIVDLVNYKSLALEYNQKIARECVQFI
ncbi:MAG: TM2 domain-containing protein [Marinilabiliaceae bacterium]|nr:TM2 domain-containing protein [Marinilabiliaceae bacterium]